jgi:hypothetical protein
VDFKFRVKHVDNSTDADFLTCSSPPLTSATAAIYSFQGKLAVAVTLVPTDRIECRMYGHATGAATQICHIEWQNPSRDTRIVTTLSLGGFGGGGVSVHNDLTGRSEPDCHPEIDLRMPHDVFLADDWNTAASSALADVPGISVTLTSAGTYVIDSDLLFFVNGSLPCGFAIGGTATATCLLTYSFRTAISDAIVGDAVHVFEPVMRGTFGDGGVVAIDAESTVGWYKLRINGILIVSVAGTVKLRAYVPAGGYGDNYLLENSHMTIRKASS